jgi:hypothetical protein
MIQHKHGGRMVVKVTRQLISFDEIKHGMVEISEKVGPFMMVV